MKPNILRYLLTVAAIQIVALPFAAMWVYTPFITIPLSIGIMCVYGYRAGYFKLLLEALK